MTERPKEPLEQTISVGNSKYKVIGVLESKGSSMNESSDRQAFVPLQCARQYYGKSNSNYRITVSVSSAEEMEAAESATIAVFRNVRRLKASQQNDFELFKSDSLIAIIREDTAKFRLSAVAIGLITLARRRYWFDEYHAGIGHGAYTRDWGA